MTTKPKNGMAALSAVMLMAAAFGGPLPRIPGSGKRRTFRDDSRPDSAPPTASGAALPHIPGGDRNAICTCGCGRKRKKCPKGGIDGIEHKVFTNVIPPAHTLERGVYRDQVYVSLRDYCGKDHAIEMMDRYSESHVDKYHADEVILPEQCARLVMEMYSHDTGITTDGLLLAGRLAAEAQARLDGIAAELLREGRESGGGTVGDEGDVGARGPTGCGDLRVVDAA